MSSLKQQCEDLWIMKYSPHTLDDFVLNDDSRDKIEGYIKDGIIPNLFFCSRPGQGKTTLAKMLAHDIFGVDTLFINASDENNVETVRNKVTEFANTRSFDGRFKIIILDEADGFANKQSQMILRGLIDSASDNTRFIITANYKNRIIEALQSRLKYVDITPDRDGVIARCCHILKAEKIKNVTKDELEKLTTLVDTYYPDVRSTILSLKDCIKDGELHIEERKVDKEVLEKLYNLILDKKPVDLREYMINSEPAFYGDYPSLLANFYHYVIDRDDLDEMVKANWVIILADYISKFAVVIDPEINAAACFFSLIEKVK